MGLQVVRSADGVSAVAEPEAEPAMLTQAERTRIAAPQAPRTERPQHTVAALSEVSGRRLSRWRSRVSMAGLLPARRRR